MHMNLFKLAAALAAFAPIADAHMIMKTPKPFGGPELDNSPLTSGNFPCKVKGDPATFYNAGGLDNTMAIGEVQTLSFTGSAVHGGGSCQLAITKDLVPSASTSWQVILSIEGGCPSKSGQSADTYGFKIPDSVAPGRYVFAWTWISKLAGQPEYYMNCAPITVTGGGSKRSEANKTLAVATRGELPELFVANLADINSCKTSPSTDPEFPNPGPNVERPGTNSNFAKVEGTNCVPKDATDSGPGSGGNGGPGSGGSPPATSSAAPAASSSSAAAPTSSLGFVTSVIDAPSSSAPAATVSSAAPSSTSAAADSNPTGGPSSGSTGALSGPCDSEGMFNCDGTSYQQCASGAWTAMQPLPAGTVCAQGQSTTLWVRDNVNAPRRRLRR
ncbi:hypothetical protein DL763_003030 [Monosporascus cannonballus]|nr:hypothetical protein DL763_003030 [Monosporascus cannonballus]